MRRQPDSALGHFLLGSLDIRTGKYDQAEAALRQAIQLSPVMAQARLQLVNLLLQRGRKADAVGQLHEFVSAFPDSSFTPKVRALLQKLESSVNVQVPNYDTHWRFQGFEFQGFDAQKFRGFVNGIG